MELAGVQQEVDLKYLLCASTIAAIYALPTLAFASKIIGNG
jgi:hypothetical protein